MGLSVLHGGHFGEAGEGAGGGKGEAKQAGMPCL